MKERIDRLNTFLLSSVGLAPETFQVDVHMGVAAAEFNDELFMESHQHLLGDESSGFGMFTPVEQETDFTMSNSYLLMVRISNYSKELDWLLRLLCAWMHKENQTPKVDYSIERANSATVDLWIDLRIQERSHNDGETVRTC